MKISSRKWKYCYFWICDCCSVLMKQKQILAQSHRQKALKTMTKSLQIKKPSFPKKWKNKRKNYLKVNFLQVDQVALVENGFWKPPAIGSLDIYYMRCLFCPQPAVGYLLDETISHEMLIRYHIVIIINQWCRVFAVILTCPAIAGQPGISIRWYVKLWRVI